MPERNPGYRPGYRRVPPGQRDKFGNEVFLLATVGRLEIMGVARKPEDEGSKDPLDGMTEDSYGKNIQLYFKFNNGNRAPFPLDLTVLNTAELETLWTVLSESFEAARPIVVERDRIAEEAAANGDDTYYRRHRVHPRVSRFPGKLDPHPPGV